MTILSVLNLLEIWLRSPEYIWYFYVVLWYIDKDKNISIFEIGCGFFCIFLEKILKFIITSSENASHYLSKWFCGTNIMFVVFWNQSR